MKTKRPALRRAGFLILAAALASCVTGGRDSGARAQNRPILLSGARLIDGTGELLDDYDTIQIRDGKIFSLSKGMPDGIPAFTKVIDCSGLTIMPGFINAHVHDAHEKEQLERWARSGVTTVRDESPRPANYADFTVLRDQYRKDPTLARIVASTPIMHVEGGYGSGPSITDRADARAKVNAFIDSGADIIKFALEKELPPGHGSVVMGDGIAEEIIATAHGRGKRVSVHICRDEYALKAVSLGADDIAHMVCGPMSDETVAEALANGTIWIPTLELWQGVGWGKTAIGNLSTLYRAGVRIAFGTDFAGYYIPFDKDFPITEVHAMEKAGMAAKDIIASGTGVAAIACGLEDEIGSISVGYDADLVAYADDPLADLGMLEHPVLVFHRGFLIRDDR